MFPYIYKTTFITININGRPINIDNSHQNFNAIIEAIKTDDEDLVRSLIDVSAKITEYGQGDVAVKNGYVYYKNTLIDNSLTRRIIRMMDEGFKIEPMVQFLKNLMNNPSKRSVDELYSFLEQNDLPITEDGHFLAYKKVRADYKDIYSGTISNAVGEIVTMERNAVDDDKDSTCSTGLHFCSYGYLSHFGNDRDNRVVILKINPADVVSIPSDYNNAKGRCCKYEVIDEFKDWTEKEAFDKIVVTKTATNAKTSTTITDVVLQVICRYTASAAVSVLDEFEFDLDLVTEDVEEILDRVLKVLNIDINYTMNDIYDMYTVGGMVYYIKKNQETNTKITKNGPLRDPKTGRFVKRT